MIETEEREKNMGNHDVGRAMNAAAEVFWETMNSVGAKPTKEQCLAALDVAAKHFHGADAEFDDYCMPKEPLGRMIAIAFDWPEDKNPADDDWDAWYDGAVRPFRDRYRFC